MNRRLAVIGAILKKDALTLWPLALAAMVLPVVFGFDVARMTSPSDIHASSVWLSGAASIASGILAVMVLQLDPAMGVRHDWRTRPIRSLDMVIAKHLFLLPTVAVPWLICQVIMDAAQSRSAGEILAAGAHNYVQILYLPLVLAFAATAETLLGFIVMIAVYFVMTLFTGFGMGGPDVTVGVPFGYRPGDWITAELTQAGCFILGVGLLWLAFTRRRPWLSRAASIGGVTLGVLLLSVLMPPGGPWSAYAAASPETAASRAIAARFTSVCVGSAKNDSTFWGANGRIASTDYPGFATVAFDGVGPHQRLILDSGELTMNTPIDHVHSNIGDRVIAEAMTDGTPTIGFGFLRVWPRSETPQLDTLSAEGRFKLTLAQEVARYEFVADGKRHRIPGFGWCQIKPHANGIMPNYDCYKTGSQPDLIDIRLKDRLSFCETCRANYRPAIFEFPGGHRYAGQLLAQGPVRGATAVVTMYRTAARLERRAVGGTPHQVAGVCPAEDATGEETLARSTMARLPHQPVGPAPDPVH